MKKSAFILLTLFFLTLGKSTAQQYFSSEIAPDVILTDIEGNTYDLYELLSEGKSVVIDFFATWWGPCWEYHQSGELQSIWETYGPDGTDEVYVFYVEADAGSPLSDLMGASYTSLGNYLYDSPYPVINDHQLGNQFEISHFPTVFFICPDKRITEVGQLTLTQLENQLAQACAVPSLQNNMELLSFTNDLSPACKEESVLPTVKVQNIGTNIIKEIRCQLYMNGQPYGEQTNWDVWLETYETLDLAFGPFYLDQTTKFVLEIMEVNGESDNDPVGNIISSTKDWPVTEQGIVLLELNTDQYGEETNWEIRDEEGNLLDSGDKYPSDTTIIEAINLINYGCYEFKIFDTYGDGMCCNYSEGGYRLLDMQGNELLTGGRFLEQETGSFEYNGYIAASTDQTREFTTTVFPNPTSDLLNVHFSNSGEHKTVRILDTRGQLLMIRETDLDKLVLNLSDFVPGMYFLSTTEHSGYSNSSFIISR